MRQLSDIGLGLLLVAPIATYLFYRYRRVPKPEELLASMYQLDFAALTLLRESIYSFSVSIDQLQKIRHNAASLVNIATTHNFPGLDRWEHAYLRLRLLEINACAYWSIARKMVFRRYPRFAPKLAAAIYVEMWGYAKALTYQYRPDLIPALDMLQ